MLLKSSFGSLSFHLPQNSLVLFASLYIKLLTAKSTLFSNKGLDGSENVTWLQCIFHIYFEYILIHKLVLIHSHPSLRKGRGDGYPASKDGATTRQEVLTREEGKEQAQRFWPRMCNAMIGDGDARPGNLDPAASADTSLDSRKHVQARRFPGDSEVGVWEESSARAVLGQHELSSVEWGREWIFHGSSFLSFLQDACWVQAGWPASIHSSGRHRPQHTDSPG